MIVSLGDIVWGWRARVEVEQGEGIGSSRPCLPWPREIDGSNSTDPSADHDLVGQERIAAGEVENGLLGQLLGMVGA